MSVSLKLRDSVTCVIAYICLVLLHILVTHGGDFLGLLRDCPKSKSNCIWRQLLPPQYPQSAHSAQ